MNYVVLFAFAILAAFWVSKDAKAKGLNADIWTILVFFAAFFFLPAYLIVRNTNTKTETLHNNNNSFSTTHFLLDKNKATMKLLSIIGIIWFSILLVSIAISWEDPQTDYDTLVSWGLLGTLCGVIYSIITLVLSTKKYKLSNTKLVAALKSLGDLKEKGIITEEEFQQQKSYILKGKY